MVYVDDGGMWSESVGKLFDYFEDEDLMQFTGLFDKNGKEIFEGDILKLSEDINVVVRYSDKFGGFTTSEEGTTLFGSHLAEVVGNIYENPDLLK